MSNQEQVDALYGQIEELQNAFIENHFICRNGEDDLERLISTAIQYGEACAKRDQGIEGLNSLGVKFFSHDFNGDGFQYHDTLQEAKQAAENDLDIYRDRVADGKHVADMGEFYELSYGLVIASANYSVDTVVSEEHHQNSEYEKYEIGTEILHLFLEEGGVLAQWPQDRQMTGQDVELINAVCAGKSLEFAESFIPEVPKIIEILKAQQAEPENA